MEIAVTEYKSADTGGHSSEMVGLSSTPGGKIKLARMENRLSATQLVELVNQELQRMIEERHPVIVSGDQGDREPTLSTSQMSKIENGHRNPSTAVEIAIARVLQLSLDSLYDLPVAKIEGGFLSPRLREAVERLEGMDDDTLDACLSMIDVIHRLDQERRSHQNEIAALITRQLASGGSTPPDGDGYAGGH